MGILKAFTAGVLAASVAVTAFAQESQEGKWEEGKHFERLENEVNASSGDGIEVAEVFWYGCPHCYTFKPLVEEWEENAADDVNFVLLPAAMGRGWEPHAYAFYASEALDAHDKTHDALFEALAEERMQLNSASELADYLEDKGVDREEFVKAYNSFGVKARVQRAQSAIRGARITGVPAMIVAGKYKTSADMAGGQEEVLEVVDYLVEKERGERTE